MISAPTYIGNSGGGIFDAKSTARTMGSLIPKDVHWIKENGLRGGILIGAVTFIAFTPESVTDPFTALPVQIFHWVTRPQEEFRGLAAAAIIVLLLLLLLMNGLAMMVRLRLERRYGREG